MDKHPIFEKKNVELGLEEKLDVEFDQDYEEQEKGVVPPTCYILTLRSYKLKKIKTFNTFLKRNIIENYTPFCIELYFNKLGNFITGNEIRTSPNRIVHSYSIGPESIESFLKEYHSMIINLAKVLPQNIKSRMSGLFTENGCASKWAANKV